MVEVSKPDYLSLVNQNGTGFNIKELVTAMVDADVVPKRAINEAQLEKVENSVSAMGELKLSAATHQSSINVLKGQSLFSVTSSNSDNISVNVTDSTKLTTLSHDIADVVIAKKMVVELTGFTSLTETFTDTLSIDFGTWVKSGTAGTITSAPQNGKAYKITALTADDAATIAANSDLAAASDVALNSYFIASSDFPAGLSSTFTEVDKYSFTEKTGNTTSTLSLSGKTVSESVSLIDAIDGVTAKLIKKSEDGSDYSVVISSEAVGADSGFKITEGDGGERWKTNQVLERNGNQNTYNQLASDATFTFDGVSLSRASNEISDLMEGVTLTLQKDENAATTVYSTRSEANIRSIITDLLASLNEYKAQLDAYTYVDPGAQANGPLALDSTTRHLKTDFLRLLTSPIDGFEFGSTYLSELGIKTSDSGGLYLDETTFERTYSNSPEKFNALNQLINKSDNVNSTVYRSEYSNLPSGEYELKEVSGAWKLGSIDITRTDNGDGTYKFTASSYPGFYVTSSDGSTDLGTIYIGQGFSSIFSDYVDDLQLSTSNLSKNIEAYNETVTDISEKLEQLDIRAEVLTERYNERFGQMESMVVGFNSTKSLLENLVKSWNKED